MQPESPIPQAPTAVTQIFNESQPTFISKLIESKPFPPTILEQAGIAQSNPTVSGSVLCTAKDKVSKSQNTVGPVTTGAWGTSSIKTGKQVNGPGPQSDRPLAQI